MWNSVAQTADTTDTCNIEIMKQFAASDGPHEILIAFLQTGERKS